MAGTDFAESRGLNYSTFSSWLRLRRRVRNVELEVVNFRGTFSPARTKPPSREIYGLEVELSNGIRLSIRSEQDVEIAANVLKILEGD